MPYALSSPGMWTCYFILPEQTSLGIVLDILQFKYQLIQEAFAATQTMGYLLI